MFSALVFIISLDGGVAPSGDQVLRINMSSQKGGAHRHFDSYAREPRLHLTPASHLLSTDAPVLFPALFLHRRLHPCHLCINTAQQGRPGGARRLKRKTKRKKKKKKGV